MMELGRLPKSGETVDLDRFHFRVLRADNRRIHLLETSLHDGRSRAARHREQLIPASRKPSSPEGFLCRRILASHGNHFRQPGGPNPSTPVRRP